MGHAPLGTKGTVVRRPSPCGVYKHPHPTPPGTTCRCPGFCVNCGWTEVEHHKLPENDFSLTDPELRAELARMRKELRGTLLSFAYWLLKDEFGEGHEEEIVDKYLETQADT